MLTEALPIVLGHLPVEGALERGGVEDGTTGENWPASNGRLPNTP
jgi:hypothetical protein